jgi:hypothetical protein
MNSAAAQLRALPRGPHRQARLAGSFYAVALFTAVYAEFIVPGAMGITAIMLAVGCYVVVTLLLYAILMPVQPLIALAATFTGLAGLMLDALRWHPRGINAGMALHGLFCILVGWLLLRSAIVPRILAALMGFAGLVWLLYLAPSLVLRLSPINSFAGLLGEALPMFWLLFAGMGNSKSRQLAESPEALS